jgi:glycosyltransferase involved in cell wall biosynthesis
MSKKKIEFEFKLGLGDTVVSSCFVRDFWTICGDLFDIKMNTHFLHIWDHDPHVSDFDDPDLYIPIGPRIATQRSQTSYLHISHAYRVCIEYILKENYEIDVSIPQDTVIPELYLSEEELNKKPEIEDEYWLITTGGSPISYTSKLWPFHRWQQVIDAFPSLQFVQIGAGHDFHPRLTGKNVVDMVGQTEDIRRLMLLFYHCVGSMGLVSAQMHLAAAFKKRCVTVAGAREPTSFEHYNFHSYLTNQGCMSCPKLDSEAPTKAFKNPTQACWRNSVDACPNVVVIDNHKFTKCLAMITTDQVIKAVQDHYVGGFLNNASIDRDVIKDFFGDSYTIKSDPNSDNSIIKSNVFSQELEIPVEQSNIEPIKPLVIKGGYGNISQVVSKTKPIFKLVCNCSGWGGGERSAAWIAQAMVKKGFEVQIIGVKDSIPHPEFEKAAQAHLYTNNITDPCDILLFYVNDSVWKFEYLEYEIFKQVQAKKKIMVVNFRLGSIGVTEWTRGWDLYGFLNFTLRDSFLKKLPDANTFVLPPPVDIEPFLTKSILELDKSLHLVRVSSQAIHKFPQDSNEFIKQIKELRPLVEFSFLGYPNWLMDAPYIHKFPEYSMDVTEFLKRGNLFWYPLPDGFYDQGPRVIIEALAIGLPVIADNRGGAKDRVIPEVGWLCNSRDDWFNILANVKGNELEKKGHAAKTYARDKFDPNRWLEKILK